MSKSVKISLIFILIFLIGVLGFVASINYSLNNSQTLDSEMEEFPF